MADRIRDRLLELVQGDSQPAFDQCIVPLLSHAAAVAADLAELLTWRSGRPSTDPGRFGEYERDGDGSEEVGNAVDTIHLLLSWIAWLIADDRDIDDQ